MTDANGSMTSNNSLKLVGVCKRFGTVVALDQVSVQFAPGETHAVVGENGSGKSTLLGVASGVVAADKGHMEVGGERVLKASSRLARGLGIASVFQTRSLASDLTVGENLYLSTEAWSHGVRYSDRSRWAADKLRDFELDLDGGAPVSALGLGQMQMLEIVKAILTRPRILLLDEPTTALGPGEIDGLHSLVSDLVESGGTVVYVSHRLPEVLSVASRVTVMRDGVSQGTFDTSAMSEAELVTLMVGDSAAGGSPADAPPAPAVAVDRDRPVLQIRGLSAHNLGPIDLTVGLGEIVGIAGAEGNGQRALLESIGGLRRSAGEVVGPKGAVISRKAPRGPLSAGVIFLSGDRRASLIGVLGIRVNTTVSSLRAFHTGGVIRARRERSAVSGLMSRLRVRTPALDQPVQLLSGGNQQKVLLARPLLDEGFRVLLVEEPTQGVDVQSRADIYAALRDRARTGAGIVVASSDLTELVTLCDRVVVMSRGHIVQELPRADLDERTVIEAVVGAGSPGATTERAGASHADAPVARLRRSATSDRKVHRIRLPAGTGGRFSRMMPLILLALLTLGLGGYTSANSASFLTSLNVNNLLLSTIPLAVIAIAQSNVMVVAGFDMSVGFTATFAVVVGSFVLSGTSAGVLLLGVIIIILCGVAVGAFNGSLVTRLSLPPIIATVASLSLLEGAALLLRPVPGGGINSTLASALNTAISGVPISFIAVAVLAVVSDVVLYGTRAGLITRFVGLDPGSAQRIGIRTRRIQLRAYVISSTLAALGGLLLGAQVGIGDASVGSGYALTSVAAAVLGGASLFGGRGSFIGAAWGALFLSLIANAATPLGWNASVVEISTGVLTLVAVIFYSLRGAGRARLSPQGLARATRAALIPSGR